MCCELSVCDRESRRETGIQRRGKEKEVTVREGKTKV